MMKKTLAWWAALFLTVLFCRSAQAQYDPNPGGCVPSCRVGYVCVKGQCVSACNPPCAQGEMCTAQGQCIQNAPPPPPPPPPAAAPAPPSAAPPGAAPAAAPAPAAPPGAAPAAPAAPVAPVPMGALPPGGAPVAPPAEPGPRSWGLSGKVGILLPGTVNIDPPGEDADSDSGLLLVAKADGFLMPKFSVGGQLLMAFSSLDADEGVDVTVTNFGGVLKAHFGSPQFTFAPGLALSYQTISGSDIDTIKGFSPGAFVELLFPIGPTVRGDGEIGFISQPSGGNEDVDVKFGPIFYLAFGVEIGG